MLKYLRMMNKYRYVDCCSVAQSCCRNCCNHMDCRKQGFPVLHCFSEFAKLTFIEQMMPYKHLILSHPLLPLPSVFPRISVFSSESALCIRWSKYWSFNFSISPSNKYSVLISFRIDSFNLLTSKEILKCLLQHLILKSSILQCSAFFMVQLSHSYMTTGKTISSVQSLSCVRLFVTP